MRELRRALIHRALNRPNLFLGCDRELVLSSLMIAAVLVLVIQTWWSTTLAFVMWIVVVGVLRRMAKADPFMRQVYSRHMKYSQAVYPARPHASAPTREIRTSWK